jgi:RepB DNA-primase from phage plasmid
MSEPFSLTAPEYILDAFNQMERIAVLALNRELHETVQRITSADKAASAEFQAWLRHKNASGSDIYIGMNPLRPDAATRTKDEIESIRHVYLDLDYSAGKALEEVKKSKVVPTPNVVLTTSPNKFQVVWKVDGMTLEEAEALLHSLAREFGGDPAATDATRVLRLPGFANKKYDTDFYVEAQKRSSEVYHLRDFKLHIDAQDSPRHYHRSRERKESGERPITQSEHDWAFAKRALARGEDPEAVIQQIANFRNGQKNDPVYYARLTVTKALNELNASAPEQKPAPEP